MTQEASKEPEEQKLLSQPSAPPQELHSFPHTNLYRVAGDARERLIQDAVLSLVYYPDLELYGMAMGPFKYTLSIEVPVLRHGTQFIYTLPDIDSFYGLQLDPRAEPAEVQLLEKILKENTYFTVNPTELVEPQPVAVKKGRAEKLADCLTGGAEFVSVALVSTAEAAAKGIRRGTEFVTSRFVNKKEPPAKVSPGVHKVVHGAREVVQGVHTIKDQTVLLASLITRS